MSTAIQSVIAPISLLHLHKQIQGVVSLQNQYAGCGSAAHMSQRCAHIQTAAATGWPPAGGAEPAGFVWAIMLPVAEDTAAIGAIKNAKGSAGPACTSSGILG